MKAWSIAALVAGIVLIPLAVRTLRREKPVPVNANQNVRYDIDELISDQDL